MPSCDGSNCGACSSSCSSDTDLKKINQLEKKLRNLKLNLNKYLKENKLLRDIIIKNELIKTKNAKRKFSPIKKIK